MSGLITLAEFVRWRSRMFYARRRSSDLVPSDWLWQAAGDELLSAAHLWPQFRAGRQ